VPAAKVALVTGANKGIGFESARQLALLGVTVLLGARDDVRGKQAADALAEDGLPVTPVRIDVTDSVSIADAARDIETRHGRLDILVNNAGIAGPFQVPPSTATVEALREVYETNVFGVVAVTNALLPLLHRSPAGRIVNLTSHTGALGLALDQQSPFWPQNMLGYQSSKTALNAITVAYAKQLWDTGIKVNAANPGLVATDINDHRGNRTAAQGAAIVVRLATLGQDGPSGTSQDDDGAVPW
jgi:NAD(P)-dependent dehydrogenase (short-subunit alcohol dehydrogenase family)